jgi:alkaline phosphatase/alkaline phosphatase D
VFGGTEAAAQPGPSCSFKTLPGGETDTPVRFIVGSCMNYNKFMHGKRGKASGPLTATEEDKRLGFPSVESMQKLRPDFFVGTGDIVYYDNPLRVAKTVPQLRQCWHEQFRFPRLIEFFRHVPAYWSKDDHDFRFNESDNTTDALPLPKTGIDMFREQLPLVVTGGDKPSYRTHRVSKDLQIWLTEGRDYRSPNAMPDGPEKSLWGAEQREWLKTTLKASDAKWKILISPTPMVGPDDLKKIDNHADLSGFRHEADAFFAWLKEKNIENLTLVCGDRHWQYHSIHPSGIHEFACGALNDENARMGVAPGAKNGSDPQALIKQEYTSATPQGGFLQITAGDELVFEHFDSRGKLLHRVVL